MSQFNKGLPSQQSCVDIEMAVLESMLYEISEAQAYRHMRRMKEIYEIDENRLPRRGVLPVSIVKDYFHQGKKKKDAFYAYSHTYSIGIKRFSSTLRLSSFGKVIFSSPLSKLARISSSRIAFPT